MKIITLQHVLLPNEESFMQEVELFYRTNTEKTKIEKGKITFKKGQTVSFDTYLNSFSATKWVEYTNANNEFGLKLKFKGKFLLKLMKYELGFNNNVNTEFSSIMEISSKEEKEETFYFDSKCSCGLLAFTLTALEDKSVYSGAEFVGKVYEEERDVKIGIGICTFKREKYVIQNVNMLVKDILENKKSEMHDKLEIFISDNAQTLLEQDFGSKKVHVFANKNTGGSGGFTRCMIEVNNANENNSNFSHILLMDDDVLFLSESIYRTYKLLTLVKEEYKDVFIGGAMFNIFKPNIQYCSGEKVDLKHFVTATIMSFNMNMDMRKKNSIVQNELILDNNHQAWWYCCIPMETGTINNLSATFFIKWDDIEYSLRNKAEIIMLNGICTWHESFNSKYSAINEYYALRNFLITKSICGEEMKKTTLCDEIKKSIYKFLTNYQYLEAEFVLDAIDDFIFGVDKFKCIDLAEKHKQLMQRKHTLVDAKALPFEVEDLYDEQAPFVHQGKIKRFIRKVTGNGVVFPAKGYAVSPVWGNNYQAVYRKKYNILFLYETKKAIVLRRSLSKFISLFRRYRKTMKLIKKNFDKVYKEYYDRREELFSYETWEKQLFE